MFTKRNLVLNPLSHVEKGHEQGRFIAWRMTDNDPAFLMEGVASYPAGVYVLRVETPQGRKAMHRPVLYVDSGNDFNEGETVDLRFNGERLSIAVFELPKGALRLRFDPSDGPGEVVLGSVSIVRVPRRYHQIRELVTLGRDRVRSPGHALHLAGRASGVLRREGIRGLRTAMRKWSVDHGAGAMVRSYAEWISLYDEITPLELAAFAEQSAALSIRPLISVLMPVYNTPEKLLREAIDSVLTQVYDNWQLCIANDASTDPAVRRVLDEYAAREPRIAVAHRSKNGHISEASNSALELVKGEWIALLDHDDLLRPHALLEVAQEIEAHPDAGLIYSDEDKINGTGERYDAFFKPDFSLEQLRAQNYFNHLTVHRADLVREVGGWRRGFEGSQDYDLNLRVVERLQREQIRHIPKVLYHWRAVEGSTASSGDEKGYAYHAGLKALQEHAARCEDGASVEAVAGLPFYRYRPAIPSPEPLVSLIIPTRDRLELIRNCVGSILERTTYRSFEILIIDNGSVEPESLAWFESFADHPQVRVLRYDQPFNYSAINNFGVREAKGSIVGLVNNDIEVIAPGWLGEMVSFAAQPEIGCVGAKLYYADDTIQHGGVVLGVGGVANHSHLRLHRDRDGYFGRLRVHHNCSAVTAACLLVSRSIYEEVGGLNERDLAVAFNDVDFCLKVMTKGYRNVFTPFAELYHLESVSRGREDSPEKIARFNREIEYMLTTWPALIRRDPYYSVNLSISYTDYSPAFPPRIGRFARKQPDRQAEAAALEHL
ncbi:glycosyltransferase family 2 protein [Aureimonas mangrovi]|uniref:glycosyltransferase family 2 protein n=1 Tax=Aureimonas mangrovi TaxID=2758041 RepID=UPI00163D997E|nr:glycosyltransferase family 2 protein [Aureimonas mangrovi]